MKSTAERLGELADLDDSPEDEWTPWAEGVTEIRSCQRCANPRRLRQWEDGRYLCAWCHDHAAIDPLAGLDGAPS